MSTKKVINTQLPVCVYTDSHEDGIGLFRLLRNSVTASSPKITKDKKCAIPLTNATTQKFSDLEIIVKEEWQPKRSANTEK